VGCAGVGALAAHGLSSTSRGSSGLSFTRYPLPRRRGLRRPADGTDPTARPGRHGLAHR